MDIKNVTEFSQKQCNYSDLQLIIVTSKCSLNCNLNLELIAKNIKINSEIIGKKYIDFIEEGEIKVSKKSKSKLDVIKTRKDFSNQCTIIIKLFDGKKINLKIFANGNIVITGGLSELDGIKAIKIFIDNIKNLNEYYKIEDIKSINKYFKTYNSYVKFVQKNYLIILKLFCIFNINISISLDIILNKKINNYNNNELQLINNSIVINEKESIQNYLKIIQIIKIYTLYYSSNEILSYLNNKNDNLITPNIKLLYNGQILQFFPTFKLNELNKSHKITIENYNTMFNTNFSFNRKILTDILNEKYTQNVIISAKFEPSNYQGINVKYISKIECVLCVAKKCKCKEISFLLFQEGTIIITGGKTWNQIIDGYKTITEILTKEYEKIVSVKIIDRSTHSLNPTIIKNTDNNIILLNKEKIIWKNPRNYFLLKKLNLQDIYL